MNNFEDKLKTICKSNINVPTDYKNSVNEALEYVFNMKIDASKNIKVNKKLITNKFVRVLQKVAIFILIVALGLTTYAGITGNLSFEKLGLQKLSQNFEENKVSVECNIENDYFSLNLENIAMDSAYVILEYKLNLKEKAIKEIGEITYTDARGYNIGLANTVMLNGESNLFTIANLEKESDTEYSYYQIVNTMIYENKVIDLKIWFDYFWHESYNNEVVPINETIKISLEMDNLVQENFEKQEQKLEDGSMIILDKVMNTNFQTFVRIKRIVDDITWEEYNDSNFLQYKGFLITDTNNNLIPYRTYTSDIIGRKYYSKETGESIEREKVYKMKNDDKIKIEENYVILLDDVKDIKNIKVIPIKSRMYNDRTNEEKEMYYKATWYPLVEGDKKYTATSNLGGTLEINNIVIDEENITFYYTKQGIVENGTGYVLIRKNNGYMNYICASKQDETNSGKIVFRRNQMGAAGLAGYGMNPEEYYTMLEKLEDLEFTLLFGKVTEYDGTPFETIIPEQSNQEVKIDNINKVKTNTAIIKFNYGETDYNYNYTIDYDSNNDILKNDGSLDILNYRDEDGNYKTIYVNDYEKADELIKDIKEHLNFKNIEFTIEYQ